jgi:hypothetical protein
MIQIAGGIILAFFVLTFLPELLRITWWLIKFAVFMAAILILVGMVMGWFH